MGNAYQIPILLEQLMSWERGFSHEVDYLETPTGLYLGIDTKETGGYFCTPVDSYPFARTGVDGIHYAFLTDFGHVTNLDEAPVIRVSPMDSDRVSLVARNLHDFFALYLFDELVTMNEYSSEEEYLEYVRKEEAKDLNSEWFDHDRWKREKAIVQNSISETFNIFPISNPVQYMQEIRLERSLQVSTLTKDSLGIVLSKVIPGESEVLIASVRDFQYSACFDRAIIEPLAKELVQLGFIHEAQSLLARMLQ
ncbi:hypothetical protein PALU110988_17400 [Paenibacillus lupini]|uniref:hypothetical protein n=1 Tax=Paenibacillus lupini TaxID=1450204 RepID=UPI00141ED416|nr:hypothetical protein [Paenibacillus lupini]NIK24636.1 hypothetical protein [Paenibacillus lupini]